VAKHKGHRVIGRKIAKLRREGKTGDQAAGQAYGMARHGDLGPAAKAAAGKRKRTRVRVKKRR